MKKLEDLPKYLRHDLEQVEKYSWKNSTVYDCLLDEVWGSINACWCDGVISWDEAEELRERYYWSKFSREGEE